MVRKLILGMCQSWNSGAANQDEKQLAPSVSRSFRDNSTYRIGAVLLDKMILPSYSLAPQFNFEPEESYESGPRE